MTCMLLSPWQLFSKPHRWSPMDPGLPIQLPSDFGKHQYGYAASESESPQASNGSGKRRASRAGTRSVSTLSAAQLERKRANDRDAQRAIRQRTKDHIDNLEKTINELRIGQEATEKLMAATQQQNRELLEENAYLRSKLSEAGIVISGAPHQYPNRLETAQCSLPSSSPVAAIPVSSSQPDDITSTPRSTLSLTTSQSSDSQQSSWQPSQSNVGQSAPANLPATSMVQAGPNLSNWRPHDGLQNTHSGSIQVQDPSQSQSHILYGTSMGSQDAQWDTTPQTHLYQGQQLHPQHESNLQQQSQQYTNAVVPTYAALSNPQQTAYQPPAPPQAEFQSMTVASPVGYPVPEQHRAFTHRTQYAMSPPEVGPVVHSSDFRPQTAQIQTGLPFGQPYTPTQSAHQYTPHAHQHIPFRDGSVSHSYPHVHYPSG